MRAAAAADWIELQSCLVCELDVCVFNETCKSTLVSTVHILQLVEFVLQRQQELISRHVSSSACFDCADGSISWRSFSPLRLIALGSIVGSVCALSFGPFIAMVTVAQLQRR